MSRASGMRVASCRKWRLLCLTARTLAPTEPGARRPRRHCSSLFLTQDSIVSCSPMVDEQLLGEIFGAFGELITCKIVHDSAGVHGHCDYADFTSASTALAALNGREVLGSQLGVAWRTVKGAKEDTSQHITVFCGNIGDQIDEYTLFEAFAQYNCSDSRVVRGEDGRCLGYGFVTIRTQDDATAAVTAMDGSRVMGRPLRVSLARTARHSDTGSSGGGGARPPDPPASTDVVTVARQTPETNMTVHVGNLLGTETEENMRNAFKEYGEIDNIRVPGKNFGFVAFTTHLAAAAAIANKNGTTPPGFTRPVRCTWASERRNPPPSSTTPAVAGPGMPPPGMPMGGPPPGHYGGPPPPGHYGGGYPPSGGHGPPPGAWGAPGGGYGGPPPGHWGPPPHAGYGPPPGSWGAPPHGGWGVGPGHPWDPVPWGGGCGGEVCRSRGRTPSSHD